MIIKTPMMSFPHQFDVSNKSNPIYDESGAIIGITEIKFRARGFVDAATSGREAPIVPNGKGQNTYTFTVLTPYDPRISETSTLLFEDRALEIAWITDDGGSKTNMLLYCSEVKR